MRELERDYIFEFAGMPQSGKSTVKDTLLHYLKRMEYPVVEFNGGSRLVSARLPIYRMPIEDLNEELAREIVGFMRLIVEGRYPGHNIYLFDRGLIDRCIFTDALVRAGKIFQEQARETYETLTVPEFLERLNGVFTFVTSPETALIREYAGKLVNLHDVRSKGDVMNERFLGNMREATEYWYKEINKRRIRVVNYSELIDTTTLNTDMQGIAKRVYENIRERYPELEFLLPAAR